MSILFDFPAGVYKYRSLIRTMAVREIQSRYAGTLAGFVWSVVNPLMIILVYWFVFSVGFKVQPVGNVPFIVVFMCGMIPWTMFSETVTASTNAIVGNAHLVKKTVFPTEILPVVNLAASSTTHIIMLIILLALMFLNSIPFSFYNFQFLYYLAALSVFSMGLGWIFSAVNVFYRDTGQIVGVIMNLWFWLTPVVWMMEIIPKEYRYFIELNPMYYIVEGYRESFIYHAPFWQNYGMGIYFWGVTLLIFTIGGLTFRRLKPEFADVL